MADHTDLLVVGGGLTGLLAARRARAAGLRVTVVSHTPGSLPQTSGSLDLLAVYPTEIRRHREHPWEALAELLEREPDHPYALAGLQSVRDSWTAFLQDLAESPLAYHHAEERNQLLVTAAGTLKPTYALPQTMVENARAWERKSSTVILGIRGLVGFAPEMVVDNLRDRWFGVRPAWIAVSGPDAAPALVETFGAKQRVTVPRLASRFERADFREAFATAARPLVEGAQAVGLPAVLGYENAISVVKDLSDRLDAAVFEIPIPTPALPGVRLANWMLDTTRQEGARVIRGQPVTAIEPDATGLLHVTLWSQAGAQEVQADQVILATGRFFGGGLEATQEGVREPILGLPIQVPPSRDDWHMNTFLGAPGHPINRAGLEVDDRFRVLDPDGQPLYPNLRAAGAILAHHDWVREKSGAGISVVTGHAAVEAILRG